MDKPISPLLRLGTNCEALMTDWLKTLTGETQARLLGLLRRSRRTISELSEALGLSDNAVRTHVVALARDGIVEDAGTQKDTGGKPARVYGLSAAGEELFPKAYAAVLGEMIAEIARQDGSARAIELLRAVGERVAATAPQAPGVAARVEVAADALRSLGGDVDAVPTGAGWRLQGYACPLSSVAADHAEVCALAQALVARITGGVVVERCDRSGRPRCAFDIASGDAASRV
jgi:predicted ArsR family transcriptional regulator